MPGKPYIAVNGAVKASLGRASKEKRRGVESSSVFSENTYMAMSRMSVETWTV